MARERGSGVAIVGSDETRPTPRGPFGLVKITDFGQALDEAAGEPVGRPAHSSLTAQAAESTT